MNGDQHNGSDIKFYKKYNHRQCVRIFAQYISKMKLQTKKKLTKLSIGTFFLLGGIEYAVILPSLWLYVNETFGAEPWFFGVIFSSFVFSSLFSGPLFGLWADCTRKTKSTILFANLFEIGGNFLYFIAWSKYWVLGARLLCGVGAGVGSAINAQIARTTTSDERTAMFSMTMGLRQIGLLIGPAFNLFLKECNFNVGPFKVNAYRSPGLFMVLLWFLQEVFTLFAYHNLESITNANKEAQKVPGILNESRDENFESAFNAQSNGYVKCIPEQGGNKIGPTPGMSSINQDEIGGNIQSPKRDSLTTLRRRISSSSKITETLEIGKDIIKEEVIVLLASQFLLFFNESALEGLMTPLCKKFLGWGQFENSITFSLIAFEAILVFVIVGKLSKRLMDRWMIVIGAVFEGVALVLYIIVLAPVKPYAPQILPTIIVGTIIIVFGLPFFSVANVSLFSKLTDERTQGFAQGVLRSSSGIAMILGPLWGAGLFDKLYLMMGVMLALEVLLLTLVTLSFRRLVPPSSKDVPSQYSAISTDEKTPLLA